MANEICNLVDSEKVFEIFKKIAESVVKLGGDDDDFHRLLTNSKLVENIAEEITRGKKGMFKVKMNLEKDFNEMINASNFDKVQEGICAQFFGWDRRINRGQTECERELILVEMPSPLEISKILEKLNKLDLEPARMEHLLALAASFNPTIQLDWEIVAIGSFLITDNGDHCFPEISWNNNNFCLRLSRQNKSFFKVEWRTRFLAIRKSK